MSKDALSCTLKSYKQVIENDFGWSRFAVTEQEFCQLPTLFLHFQPNIETLAYSVKR